MNNSYTNFTKFPNFKKTPSAFLNTLKKGEKVFKTSKCFCGCDITYGTKYDEYDIYTHPHFKNKKCIKFIYNKYGNKKMWYSKKLGEKEKEIKINTNTLEEFITHIQLLHKKKNLETVYVNFIQITFPTGGLETNKNSYYMRKYPHNKYQGDTFKFIPNIIYIEREKNKPKEIIFMTPKNIV